MKIFRTAYIVSTILFVIGIFLFFFSFQISCLIENVQLPEKIIETRDATSSEVEALARASQTSVMIHNIFGVYCIFITILSWIGMHYQLFKPRFILKVLLVVSFVLTLLIFISRSLCFGCPPFVSS